MKKVFFLIVAFAFVGTAAIAQLEQKDHKKNQEEWNNKKGSTVNLNIRGIPPRLLAAFFKLPEKYC